MEKKIKVVRGAGVISIQVWTESLRGRPFPAWTVLVDLKDDGTFLCPSSTPALVALRKEILAKI